MNASHAESVFSGEETAETVISTGSKLQSQQPEAGMDVDKHIVAGLRL